MTQKSIFDSKPESGNEHELEGTISIYDFLDGISQLSIAGVIETTAIVEAIHREIVLRPLGLLNHRYGRFWHQGISSRVYGVVKGITSLVGHSLAFGIHQYSHFLAPKNPQPLPNHLSLVVNALNGVMGDHLVSQNNPLALHMTFYALEASHDTKPLYIPPNLTRETNLPSSSPVELPDNTLSGRVVIMLHGLCMGYLNWQPQNERALGAKVLKELPEATVLYLNYNTGQRISTNGHQFAELMHRLTVHHPEITSIDLIGHSMGGLVSRSALYYGKQAQYKWVEKVDKLITLGTPHHGAVLERIGDFVQQSIAKLPFAGALAKLGDIRSAGIIDLRHGSVRDEDWQSLQTRSVLPDGARHFTPLPEHVAGYFIAGSLSVEGDESAVR